MTGAEDFRSGKGHRDENFPVASRLVHPRYRGVILAFYEFVRVADDIADHSALSKTEKLAGLERLEDCLLGRNESEPQGVALRQALSAHALSPRHAQDLLKAFRMDVTKNRYADWNELIHYCSFSAMPVGRFLLDVHGEDRRTWAASDAICAALQIINHLQDCGKDFRDLDRVYIPAEAFAAAGARVDDLGAARASPELRACISALAQRTHALLQEGQVLPDQISDLRLSLEISVIYGLADQLVHLLRHRDPLSERVHLGKLGFLGRGAFAVTAALVRRPLRRQSFARAQAPQ